jgi:hypothetical protein
MDKMDTKVDELRKELDNIELDVLTQGYTLADAIREGCKVTQQYIGGFVADGGERMCALSAANLAARTRGIIK